MRKLKNKFFFTVGEEKNKKDVDFHSVKAAEYLHDLDVNLAPKKPITWMLIRPPWSISKSICLKHLVHKQMLNIKVILCYYKIILYCKIESLKNLMNIFVSK